MGFLGVQLIMKTIFNKQGDVYAARKRDDGGAGLGRQV